MLSDTEKKDLWETFESISKAQNIEVDVLLDTFNNALDNIERTPSAKGKPRRYILKRALSALEVSLANSEKKGIPFVFLPFGPLGDPRNWNKKQYQLMYNEFNRPGVSIKDLIKKGKLMTMEVDGRAVPVSKIFKVRKEPRYFVNGKIVVDKPDSGDFKEINEIFVVEGEPWKKGEGTPLFRDFIENNNGHVNFGWSNVLGPRWEFTLVGLACPEGGSQEQTRLFEQKISYSAADSDNEDFFFKKYQPFKYYVSNFELVEDKCTGYKYVFKGQKLEAKSAEVDDTDYLDYEIQDIVENLREKFPEANIPYFLDGFINLEKYHDWASLKDKEGNVVTNEYKEVVYEKSSYDKYAILCTVVTGIGEPTGTGSAKYYLNDKLLNYKTTAWESKWSKTIFNVPSKIPGKCLLLIKTGRKSTIYNPVTKDNVQAENGKGDFTITPYSIASVGSSVEIEKI